MSSDALHRLKNTLVYQALLRAEESLGGDHQLSEHCSEVVHRVAPLLERIPEKMPEFTLHDPNHSAKILDLIASITPEDTLNQLNAIELAIVISSAYLHDIGMTCSSDERDAIIGSDPQFRVLLFSDDDRAVAYRSAVDAGQHRLASRIEDCVFVEYLRLHHVDRTDNYIEEIQSLFTWHDTPFARWVRLVCKSHGGPAAALVNEVDYPRVALVRNLRVNVQYLSVLLRLADILDLDPERTPTALFAFINPIDPGSIREWHKHRSVVGWDITPERVVFEAECTQPAYERALRTFLHWIDNERRDSLLLLGRYDDTLAKRYRLDLVHPVNADRIRSNGSYIFSDLRFMIDHKKVMALLGGIRLYKDPLLAIRELLQNAADAVRHRQAIDADFGEPSIRVTLEAKTLTVEDNGIGMDEHIFREYFIQLGRSFYTSSDFRAAPVIDAVSEFGIGALASFMIATTVVVESRRLPADPLKPPAPVLFEIPTASDFFVQRPTSRTTIGTAVVLRLREDIALDFDELENTVRRVAPMLELPISIASGESTSVVQQDPALLPASASSFAIVPLPLGEQPVLRHVDGVIQIRREARGEAALVVAQRGFLVGSRGFVNHRSVGDSVNLGAVLPDWTSCVARLNLRGDAKLTLTPDRRDVVHDARFHLLKGALDNAIVRAVREKLEAAFSELIEPAERKAFSDGLLEKGILRAETYVGFALGAEVRALVEEFLYVQVLDENSTFVCRRIGELLAQPKLVVTSISDWPEGVATADIRAAADEVIRSTLPIIVRPAEGTYYFDNFLEHLYGDISGLYISRIPGLVFDCATKGHLEEAKLGGHLEIAEELVSSVGQPVFAHSASPTMVQHVRYNPAHRLIRPFINEERQAVNARAKELVIELDEAVQESLGNTVSAPLVFRREGAGVTSVGRRDGINRHLHGCVRGNGALVAELETAFGRLWEQGRAAELVSGSFPGFGPTDLPWFWSDDPSRLRGSP